MAHKDSPQINTTRPLPHAPYEYDHVDADRLRRIVEQNFDEIGTRISRLEDQVDRDAFLASVANNFLFMGA